MQSLSKLFGKVRSGNKASAAEISNGLAPATKRYNFAYTKSK